MQLLPLRPAEVIRVTIYRNWEPSKVEGYDVSINDPSNSDFLPLTTDWYEFGEHYPNIAITNFEGNTVNGGTTGYTGIQGDGSGVNQQRDITGLVTIRAEDEDTYNGVGPKRIVHILGNHVQSIIQDSAPKPQDSNGPIAFQKYGTGTYGSSIYGAANGFWYVGVENPEMIVDDTETAVTFQKQFQVSLGYNDEP